MTLDDLKLLGRLLREILPPALFGRGPSLDSQLILLRNIQLANLNIKNLGYELGKRMASQLAQMPAPDAPGRHGLTSKPTTQSDIDSSWFIYWCARLKVAPLYHRKLWEFAFVLQALHEHDLLAPGRRGIGFGCGEEPLASYFASIGIDTLVTDLEPSRVAGLGWQETHQHASSSEQAFHGDIVARDLFDRHVSHRHIDMNQLPVFDQLYDFCWSVCALEHLGSIAKGLEFIENSLAAIKPGGIAVFTTEFNCQPDGSTIDNWMTVLFQRKHFEALSARLTKQGHCMLGPDFDIGDGVLDHFVDLPPYSIGEGLQLHGQWAPVNQMAHLKLAIEGYAATCYGIIIRKAGG